MGATLFRGAMRGLLVAGSAAALALLTGCPQAVLTEEFISGTTGDNAQLGATPLVDVLAPVSDFSITGGTPVELAWRNVARSTLARLEVFLDADENPNNGNETVIEGELPLTTSSLVINTTRLAAGRYFIGVRQREVGSIVAFDYATGRITVNQAPDLFFTSPRDSFTFDRTLDVNPSFNVAWSVSDPDSVVSVRIFLDPDSTPDGDEVLLRESNSQTGDTFTFDLPTASFAAGTYRILAIVSDGLGTFPVYAPGTIRLRNRLAGKIDLRDIELPTSALRGAVFEGFNPGDNCGSRVASINDIDNDGFEDFILVSQFGRPDYAFNLQRTGVGEAYLVYGRAERFSGRVNLNSTGVLFRGDVFTGVPEVRDPIRPSRGITAITSLDDWDRDGVREVAFGLPFTDSLRLNDENELDPDGYFRSGAVVIMAGATLRPDIGFPGRNPIDLSDIGTIEQVGPGDSCFIPGNPNPCVCPEGFYGPKAPQSITGDDDTYFYQHIPGGPYRLSGERLGCRISTIDFNDQCGEFLDRYEYDGIIISVPNRDSQACSINVLSPVAGAGAVSVYYNNTGNGTYLWSLIGGPGASPTYGGPTVNTDERAIPHSGPYHFILDDQRIDPDEGLPFSPGYIATVDALPCTPVPDFGAPPDPAKTTRFYGGFAGARVGNAVRVSDFNDDGIDDIGIGSPLSNNGSGAVFIVFGRIRDLMRGADLNLEELGLPLNSGNPSGSRVFDGIRVIGSPGDRLGESQDSAGDFNGDGIGDIVIGSAFVNNRRGGATVFFGGRETINLTEAEIPLAEIPSRNLGVTFVGEAEGDLAGTRVAGIRDFDGDGLDDILIAAPQRSVRLDIDLDGQIEIDRQACGVVYLIYGSSTLRGTINLSAIGTPQLPGVVFIGAGSDHQLGASIGEQGDRSFGIATAGDVDGDGNVDLLLSSPRATPRGGRTRAGESYLIYGVGEQ